MQIASGFTCIQQRNALREAFWMENAVFFQDDALLSLLKKSGGSAAGPQAAALVHIGIEALDLTGPVDLVFYHRAAGD